MAIVSRVVLLLGLATMVWVPRAAAQFMKNELAVSVGGGLADPTGLFEDEVKTGVNFMAGLEWYINPSWSLGLRGAYITLDAEPLAELNTGVTGIDYWNTDAETHLMLYPESWFSPYLAAGMGINLEQTAIQDSAGPRGRDMLRFGMTAGVGISVHRQTKRWALFTELIYHHMPSEGTSRQGVRWSTGLRICFGGRPF